MSAVAELEEETAATEPMRLDVRFGGVDLAAPSSADWVAVNRRPIAFLPYEGDMPRLMWPEPQTPEQRLARVPADLQQLLIERGRTLERHEQAQRDFDRACSRLAQLDERAAAEDVRKQHFAQQRAEIEERRRAEFLELQMQMRLRSAWVGHGVCCTPGRDEV